ncbi:MAG: redox-sensing transcriptional repressor Rex, partial [Clostridia bacterium]|nr:redox-sensing transcriptional repressor Rex [Clostridia bacterium]
MNKDIPVISLQRLPVYLNYLKGLPEEEKFVSSKSIADALD